MIFYKIGKRDMELEGIRFAAFVPVRGKSTANDAESEASAFRPNPTEALSELSRCRWIAGNIAFQDRASLTTERLSDF